jgi:hypothetical protein
MIKRDHDTPVVISHTTYRLTRFDSSLTDFWRFQSLTLQLAFNIFAIDLLPSISAKPQSGDSHIDHNAPNLA